jgi:bacillithiol synthase
LPTADCHPIDVLPGLSRLFLDFCDGNPSVKPFFKSHPGDPSWQQHSQVLDHRSEIVSILARQNPLPAAVSALEALRAGAGTVVTGQQVGLFGGPLFTPLKAATALARARQASANGFPHTAIFWLATEDHDFEEINHVTFPSRKELRKLAYTTTPTVPQTVGGIVFDESITPLLEQASELLGFSDAMEVIQEAYRPERTFAQAFADFYAKAFAAQGLLILDAGSREVHRLGIPVLRAAIERADELHAALVERNRCLEEAGYHTQVAVAPQSSLLFLIDEQTHARIALKRITPNAAEPEGSWQAGKEVYSTADLLGILEAEPERISPSALLRPVFQDFLLSSSLVIGGPAEIAYFAQSGVLYEKLLGRVTPSEPRLSATLIEPNIADLLRKHDLPFERMLEGDADFLAQLLGARALPIEGKRKLAAAGNALDAELTALLEWMQALDVELGKSAETAASKIKYQMSRLRRLAADFQLQREASISRHAHAISNAIYPQGLMQERLLGAAYYFARYGFGLAETLTEQAADVCPGHKIIWL